MQFLYDDEVKEWAAVRGLLGTVERDLRTRLYYDPPTHARQQFFAANEFDQVSQLARSVVETLGVWDDAVLWITEWGIWPSSEDWPTYYAARGARGERRALSDTPGHQFAADEQSALVEFITFVLRNGWGAFVLTALHAQLNPIRVHISHDEWIAVQSDDRSLIGAPDA